MKRVLDLVLMGPGPPLSYKVKLMAQRMIGRYSRSDDLTRRWGVGPANIYIYIYIYIYII